jgi:murein DD-endopeptidase MepM/ murein hydrolase activator NlpD
LRKSKSTEIRRDFALWISIIPVIFTIIFLMFFSCNFKDNKRCTHFVSCIFKKVDFDTIYVASNFDFPVGKPEAKGYYIAQNFGDNNHLGEDWNGNGGGNTDLGDPIYSIANGYVCFSENIYGGWGKVIRIVHFIDKNMYVESLYAHCEEILVKTGQFVRRGQQIGTIGNNNGQYLAHLHFELRSIAGMPIGGGYSSNTEGRLNPTEFINNNR